MDELFSMIVIVVVLIFGYIGVMHVSVDYRHFNVIIKRCESQGFIQDKHTRIICTVEERDKK